MDDQYGIERRLARERAELREAVRLERHNSITPVPEEDRNATALDQFWI